jgi:hypothetical protein
MRPYDPRFSNVARLPVIHASLSAHTHALHTHALHTFHLVISENVARLQAIHTPYAMLSSGATACDAYLALSISLFLSFSLISFSFCDILKLLHESSLSLSGS